MKIRMSVEQQNKEEFINALIKKYHFKETDMSELISVYENMQMSIGAYASYRINTKVTGVPEIDNNQAAMVAMTLGSGIDRLAESYIRKEQLERSYMLDCIANELLLKMYKEFNTAYVRFHRRYVMKYVFIGKEIPLGEIPTILAEIKGRKEITNEQGAEVIPHDSNEINANEYGVLSPSKSVVFYAILSENPNTECEGICEGCSNTECENRYVSNGEDSVINKHRQNHDKEGVLDEENRVNADKVNMNYGFQRIFGQSI